MDTRKSLLPALLAMGGGLAATQAAALELGEINVQSTLGQPLRASIAYALGPNEQLGDYCVSLRPAASQALPAIGNAKISVANGIIRLTGKNVVSEPLMSLQVNVACPYTPKLSREYMLFIDPPSAQPAGTLLAQPATLPAPVAVTMASPATARAATAPVSATPRRQTQTRTSAPIDATQRYRVQPGDSLSAIATRIENRPVSLWDAVNRIFEANPGAFIDQDPNKLKAGSWLVIPEFAAADAAEPTRTFAPAAVAFADESTESFASGVYDLAPDEAPATDDTANLEPVRTIDPFELDEVDRSVAANAAVGDRTAVDAVAGDADGGGDASSVASERAAIATVADSDVVANLRPGDVILDTELKPVSSNESPNVPVATIAPTPVVTPAAETSNQWLAWLASTGGILIAGLLAWGYRRRREEDAPISELPMRRASDRGEDTSEYAEFDPDYEIDDDAPTQENLVLDADLVLGTGLDDGGDVDIAQDYGFAATTELDLELPGSAPEPEAEKPQTDILAAPHIDDSSILESEVLPDDEDYDMSIMVDATRMPAADDATERDLQAVVVEDSDEPLIRSDYTISQESEYQILEQDYEDEFTGTYAANAEIEKAAAQLADRLDELEAGEIDLDAKTTEMPAVDDLPLATVTELDVTANIVPNDSADTVEMNASVDEEKTEEIDPNEATVEMPPALGKKA